MDDMEGLFHSVESNIRQQRTNHAALRGSRFAFMKNVLVHISCFQPLFDEFDTRNSSNRREQIFMADVIERSHNSIPYSTTQMKRTGQRLKSAIPHIPCSDVAFRSSRSVLLCREQGLLLSRTESIWSCGCLSPRLHWLHLGPSSPPNLRWTLSRSS